MSLRERNAKGILLGCHQSVYNNSLFYSSQIGSLSNDDSDGNENGNIFARASRFFVHYFTVARD